MAYDNDKFETVTVIAGRCDAVLRVPIAPLPVLNGTALSAKWLGQDGAERRFAWRRACRGDRIAGLVVDRGGVLTDGVRENWMYRSGDRASIPDDPAALALVVKPRSDGSGGRSVLRPYRDESQETMTLRLITASGHNFVVTFSGTGLRLETKSIAPGPS